MTSTATTTSYSPGWLQTGWRPQSDPRIALQVRKARQSTSSLGPNMLGLREFVSMTPSTDPRSRERRNVGATMTESSAARRYLAGAKFETLAGVDLIRNVAARHFAGAHLQLTMYSDPEEGWEKVLINVETTLASQEHFLELEDSFLDEICADSRMASALDEVIVRIR